MGMTPLRGGHLAREEFDMGSADSDALDVDNHFTRSRYRG